MTTLCCWGLSFRTAPLDVREGLAWSAARQEMLLRHCVNASVLAEALVLATCNRVEIYIIASDATEGFAALDHVVEQFDRLSAQALRTHGYRRAGEAAVRHLFRVAASLDAMVVGEAQILGQVKDAYQAAQAQGTVGPQLHRIFQHALSCAKRVRLESGIGTRPVSVGSVAVELAQHIFGNLNDCSAAVIGVGDMSHQIVRQLKSVGIGSMTLVNRTESVAVAKAAEWGASAAGWERLPDLVRSADIVLAATAAPDAIIDVAMVRAAMAERRRPLFFLDVAVPRNIASGVSELAEVYLYDIDDLRTIAEKNLAHRQSEITRAESIIHEVVDVECREAAALQYVGPAIGRLHQKCETIRREELAKTLARLPACDTAVQAAFAACTEAIVSKILHDPILQVKQEEVTDLAKTPVAVEWLRRLFRLDETSS